MIKLNIQMKILLVLLFISVFSLVYSSLLRKVLNPKKAIKREKFIKLKKLIEESGIALKIKFYNVTIHVLLSVLAFITTYTLSRNFLGSISSVIFSVFIAIVPTAILNVLERNKISVTRKEVLNFIDKFSDQIGVHENIFDAMKSCVEFLEEPVKSVTQKALDMYDNSVDPLDCINYISSTLPGSEVKAFFDNLEYYFIEGGNISEINDEFLIELTELIEIDNIESTEDHKLFFSLYVMIALNTLIVFMSIKADPLKFIISTVYGEIALSINLAICILLIIKTLIKAGDVS